MSSREETIFLDALAVPTAERGAFLEQQCGADADLQARLVALIAAHKKSPGILAGGPGRSVAQAIAGEERAGDDIGRYKLLQKLGEGGCGVVWLAEQEQPVRRRVALKVIKLGMDTKAVVARFEAERQALALMDHPNIAKVLDGGATEMGRPFFVMELVRGIPITRFCDENQLNTQARLELFIQVCHAIQHAHQKGIIHRDIKPSNILVSEVERVDLKPLQDARKPAARGQAASPSNDAMPKVIDFGIAKATQGRLTDHTLFTAFEQIIGTPAYMSPEQAEPNALDVDTRSDIYSLGVLLYELLTGKPPFDPHTFNAAAVEHVRRLIRETEPPRPSARFRTLGEEERAFVAKQRSTVPAQLATQLRGDLEWIAMKALEKNRARRYQTANALALDVQRYLANEPVVARPPSAGYRIRKLVTRNKLAFAAGAIVVATLIAGATISTVQYYNARRALERLSAAEQRERSGRIRAESAEAAAKKAEQLAEQRRMGVENLLSFVFTGLGEHLADQGQGRILREISAKVRAYYEELSPALQTRDTRAGYAFALAEVGAGLSWTPGSVAENERAARNANLARALEIFEELESSGPLTPAMRMAYGAACAATAWTRTNDPTAVSIFERGERVVAPALSDAQWAGWAQRTLTVLLNGKGSLLVRHRRANDALLAYQRALESADLAERRSPATPWPGLRQAQIKVGLGAAQAALGRPDKAREAWEDARAVLRRYSAQQPSFQSARTWLGLAAQHTANAAFAEWRFAEYLDAQRERQVSYGEAVQLQPMTVPNHFSLAISWAGNPGSQYAYDWMQGDFQAAENDVRRAIDLLSFSWIGSPAAPSLAQLRFEWARVCAATTRNAEADRQLQEVESLGRQFAPPELESTERSLRLAFVRGLVAEVELERLNWSMARQHAVTTLRHLDELTAQGDFAGQIAARRILTNRILMRAAFEAGDYVAARRALDASRISSEPRPGSGPLQARFVRIADALRRIHVLARAGEQAEAKAEITNLWPEVDAVFAAGPDYLFNQVQMARALSLRAEIEGPREEKRRWLERATSYLRPAAAAGKLTRYEREVLLAGIEKQMAALD